MVQDVLKQRLEALRERSLTRKLSERSGTDLCSNDYLGFSQDPVLAARIRARLASTPIGASGSRLLRGNLDLFGPIEKQLAEFSGRESALLFPSGYQANLGLFSVLLNEHDMVFSDALNHASIVDGIRLSRSEKRIYPHRDVRALRKLLSTNAGSPGLKVIVTESLFSMDGDLAPLQELADLAKEFSAALIVDEAHATGIFGDFANGLGGGLAQSLGLTSEIFATIHTGGKALGSAGAWIAGDAVLREYLVNFSRPFIFSTAISPLLAISLSEAVSYWKEVGVARTYELRERIIKLASFLSDQINLAKQANAEKPEDLTSPIFPVILGSNESALVMSDKFRHLGFDVRAIRPPTVPEGTARLRVTLGSQLPLNELQRFAFHLNEFLHTEGGV